MILRRIAAPRRRLLLVAPVALLAAACNRDLGGLGGWAAYGHDVNDDGVVVGYGYTADDPSVGTGFRRQPDGTYITLRGMPLAVDDAGVAVGGGDPGAVAWDPDGTEHDLGAGSGSQANDIAEDGTVVGRRIGTDGVTEAFIRHPDGTVESLPRVPGSLLDEAEGVNDVGDVVGHTLTASDGQTKPVLWPAPDHQPIVLAASGSARDVGDDGTVIGNRADPRGAFVQALLWRAGTHDEVPLPLPLGTARSLAEDVNDAGQIAGTLTARYGGPDRAVRWDPGPDGSYELVELGGLGGGASHAQGINDAGDVVGYALVPGTEGTQHVVLFPADG